MSSHGSSSSSIAILTFVSPTTSTPNSFSISKTMLLLSIFTPKQLGCFNVLTIISVSFDKSAFSRNFTLNKSSYDIFLLTTVVFESLSY